MKKSKNSDVYDGGSHELKNEDNKAQKKKAAPKKNDTKLTMDENLSNELDIFGALSFDDIYNLDDIYAEVERRTGEITAGLENIDAERIAGEVRARLEKDEKAEPEQESAEPLHTETPVKQIEPDKPVVQEKPVEAQASEKTAEVDEPLIQTSEPTVRSDFSLEEFKNEADGEEETNMPESEIPDRLRPFITAFSAFYDACYILGIQTFRYSKRISTRLWRLLLRPWRYFLAVLRIFFISVDRLFFHSVHSIHDEWSYFRREVRKSFGYLRSSAKSGPVSFILVFSHYVKKAFIRHNHLFRSIANTAMPIAALLIFWLTVNYWNSVTFALKVTYNNRSIGYIKDEAVYIKAETLARERLGTSSETIAKTSEVLDKPKYELSLVKLNQLSDESAICDSLIEKSNSNITNACGIYIDGDFLCAVKNETDATSVFDNILVPYQNRKDTIAAFVEDVKYTQGLYPDTKDIMWDANRLAAKLNTKKKDAVYYTVKDGETDWDIAMDHHLKLSQLIAMNPQMGKYIHEGDKLVISNEVNFLRVKLIKTEKRYANIAYETLKSYNSSLFRGDTRTIRKGVAGRELIIESVSYVDNMRISSKIISRERISDPISAKVEIGTKSTRVNYNSGSYDVSISREGFVWPTPGCHTISSYYGYRSRGWHDGVDITSHGARGKVIVAAKDGYVESVHYSGYGLGNYVVINHGDGVKTEYGHCLSGSISVSPGQHVSAGQAIARVGASGNATGPHLHFNLIINGHNVNPLPYIS